MEIESDRDSPDGTEGSSAGPDELEIAAKAAIGGDSEFGKTSGAHRKPSFPERLAQTERSGRPSSPPQPVSTSFSAVDAALIRSSFAHVMADPPRAMEYFFARLFAQSAEIRALFPLAMAETRTTTFEMLARLIWNLDSRAESENQLSQLARDHRKFGVKDKHYQPVCDALLATVESLSGQNWTAAVQAAWQAALDQSAAVMRAAAADDAAGQPAWWVGEIVQHEQRTATVAVLTIRPDKPLSYLPGQHVAIQVPRWPRVWRSYSIANAPRDNGLLDLHVRAVPGGMVSNALVSHCGTGDTMVLGAARGEMQAPTDVERDLVCVAGGTGLAPIKAIVESVVGASGHGRRRGITLYFGVQRRQELYDMRDLETLQLAYPSLTVIPVAEYELEFSGLVGKLPAVVSRHPSFRSTDVYISGPEGMVTETVRVLSSRVPADCLHHDPLDSLRAASRLASAEYLSR